jgi:predicted RNA-binding Zn ribbon-like protein
MTDPLTEPTTQHAGDAPSDSSRPAPSRLRLVQELINTLDIEAGEDELAAPTAVASWLQARGLLGPGEMVDDDGVRALVEIREALRDLACANGGDALPDATTAVLARRSGASPVAVRVDATGTRLVPAVAGVDGAIAALLGVVHDASVDGSWSRLKCCRDEACRWAFYDHSRNRSSAWCSMAVCGNRAKARAFRRRQHG